MITSDSVCDSPAEPKPEGPGYILAPEGRPASRAAGGVTARRSDSLNFSPHARWVVCPLVLPAAGLAAWHAAGCSLSPGTLSPGSSSRVTVTRPGVTGKSDGRPGTDSELQLELELARFKMSILTVAGRALTLKLLSQCSDPAWAPGASRTGGPGPGLKLERRSDLSEASLRP